MISHDRARWLAVALREGSSLEVLKELRDYIDQQEDAEDVHCSCDDAGDGRCKRHPCYCVNCLARLEIAP
jgi:hypothetical protein